MTIGSFYVTFLCAWRSDMLGALAGLPWLNLAFELIAGQHLVPALFVVAGLAAWFEGTNREHRAIRQRSLLRAVLGAGLAWGLAAVLGAQMRVWLEPGWEAVADGACWIGVPFPAVAAAAGFAMGAALWRSDWRCGLGCLAVIGLWTMTRVARGIYYPLDAFTGALSGGIAGWAIGWAGWLERPLDSIVRFLRRMALA
jgi:hypothetical protein